MAQSVQTPGHPPGLVGGQHDVGHGTVAVADTEKESAAQGAIA